MRQKRQSGAGGMVQASNISSAQYKTHSAKWQTPAKQSQLGDVAVLQHNLSTVSQSHIIAAGDMRASKRNMSGTESRWIWLIQKHFINNISP